MVASLTNGPLIGKNCARIYIPIHFRGAAFVKVRRGPDATQQPQARASDEKDA